MTTVVRMRRKAGRVGLAAVVVAALGAGVLLFLTLRPAEPAPIRPIDIPAEEEEREGPLRIRIGPPAGGAAPVSPLPPPPAGDDDGSESGDDDADDGDDNGDDDGDDGGDDDGDDGSDDDGDD